MLNGAPPGTLGLAQKTGWMCSDLFVEVMKHTNSSKDSPTLLIYDNHESHLLMNAIDLAKDNGVQILTLLPHTSNKLQPLDVALYKPLETYYETNVASWMNHNPGKQFTILQLQWALLTLGLENIRPLKHKFVSREAANVELDKITAAEPEERTDSPHLSTPSYESLSPARPSVLQTMRQEMLPVTQKLSSVESTIDELQQKISAWMAGADHSPQHAPDPIRRSPHRPAYPTEDYEEESCESSLSPDLWGISEEENLQKNTDYGGFEPFTAEREPEVPPPSRATY
ncbi:hypothetical protein M8J77_000295 [Diaphorina citri]|nr:hypothetical protein M8J77_000295 [Diaphorina citri]